MKLKTLVPVIYNNGITEQETSIIEGVLSTCNQQLEGSFNSMYMFKYISENGQIITSNIYPITAEEINALYVQLKGQVPSKLNYTDSTTYLYYLGFRVQMATTFGIEVSEIEIIID
jgi:hypothetical protein